ncbi:MAG TPA: two-component regulator propeller domain-containing protein, partial [Ignavibacteria bacterium]|nr:two-component regulator propeller domain-containing protein [Ignavibacteria bacterium]
MKEGIFHPGQYIILGFLFIICSSGSSISQNFPSYHYSSSEGLASSTVYEMIQDKNGFIWFATANGVSKFDGHKFMNYSTSDGLNSNSIINLTESADGEIYFANYEKGYNVFKAGKMENYSAQSEKNKAIKGMFVQKDTLYSYTVENITRVGSLNTLNIYNVNPSDPFSINMILKTDNGTITATSNGLYRFVNDELFKMSIKGIEDQEIYSLYGSNDNEIIAGAGGKIFEIRNNEVARIINVDLFRNNNIIKLCKDTNGNIWFSIMNKGFFFIEAGTDKITDIGRKMGLDKTLVNNFMEDNEGNMWVSTFGDGVFCLNNLFITNYSQKDGLSNNKILAIEKDKSGRIFIGTLDGLNVLESDSINIINVNVNTIVDYMYINGIENINDLIYISGTFKTYGNISKQTYKDDKLYLFTSSAFCFTPGNEFITGGWGNEIYDQPFPPLNVVYGDTTYLFGDTRSLNKVYCIFADSRKNLWVSTAAGLCKISSGSKTYFSSSEVLRSTVKSIVQDKKDRIWFAGDKGIASYGLNDSLISYYSGTKNFSESNILSVDNYNRVWIGTMSGLMIYDLENNSVKILNSETGLPSQEILSLYYDSTRNFMWIGTAKGLSSLNVSEFDNNQLPPIKVNLRSVRADDSLYLSSGNYVFKPDKNHIQIDFNAINFSSPASVSYQYKINNEWIDISTDHINFSLLEKGDYKLEIRGKAINSQWGNPEVISFTVLPYFTETFLFRGSLGVMLLAGIAFAAHRRIRFIKARGKEKFDISNQINELKHKAL